MNQRQRLLTPDQAVDQRQLLTPEQVAARLQISVKSLAAWRSSGVTDLAHVRVGGRIRYEPLAVDEYIAKNTRSGTGGES